MEFKSLTKIALFLNVVSSDINALKFLLNGFLSFISTIWKVVALNGNCTSSQVCINKEDSKKPSVGKEDISIVMYRLGISCDLDNENIDKFDNVEDVLSLMDDDRDNAGEDDCIICLEDVRDAFGVFDINKDGFIDEMELQRVLYALDIPREDSTLVQCKRMINEFDENGDGFIDFEEFFTLINNCF